MSVEVTREERAEPKLCAYLLDLAGGLQGQFARHYEAALTAEANGLRTGVISSWSNLLM